MCRYSFAPLWTEVGGRLHTQTALTVDYMTGVQENRRLGAPQKKMGLNSLGGKYPGLAGPVSLSLQRITI